MVRQKGPVLDKLWYQYCKAASSRGSLTAIENQAEQEWAKPHGVIASHSAAAIAPLTNWRSAGALAAV